MKMLRPGSFENLLKSLGVAKHEDRSGSIGNSAQASFKIILRCGSHVRRLRSI